MTDAPANAPAVLPPIPYCYGLAAMALKTRRDLLRVLDGGRRMLGDRSPGCTNLTTIQGDKK